MLRRACQRWASIVVLSACAGDTSDPAPSFERAANGLPGPLFIDGDGAESDPSLGSADGLNPMNACAGVVHAPERLPVDMYFLVDSSGSMGERTGGGSKWDQVTAALVSFLTDPRNADIGVGIGYFPLDAQPACTAGDPGCLCIPFINLCFANIGGSCSPGDYATPAVPLSLPPSASTVVSDIASRVFAGGTPTRPALEGALQYASSWASQNPGRRTVVVLATDGDPTGCDENEPETVAEQAAAALSGPHQIRTFVIGVGRSLTSLNRVAAAGGTRRAFLTDTAGDLGQELADALGQIRDDAAPCDFSIPAETTRGRVDPTRVNVLVTPQAASETLLVSKTSAGEAASCGQADGWYYDDPTAPRAIRLCDATCRRTRDGARVEVQFGCDTIVSPPR